MENFIKINSFMRDTANHNVIIPKLVSPEMEYLKNNLWLAEEKIDGTCICLYFELNDSKIVSSEMRGHKDNSQIPAPLIKVLNEIINKISPVMEKEFGPKMIIDPATKTEIEKKFTGNITIYGEGYGNKIAKVGPKYIKDHVDFIMFDYDVNGRYATPSAARDFANTLGLRFVPVISEGMTIQDAIEYVKDGFKSFVAEDESLIAEGLVLKNPAGILDHNSKPLYIKVKYKDLQDYKRLCPDAESFKI